MYSETTSFKASKIVCDTHRNPSYTITKVTVTDIEGNEVEHKIFHDDDMTVEVELKEEVLTWQPNVAMIVSLMTIKNIV